jgi:transposase
MACTDARLKIGDRIVKRSEKIEAILKMRLEGMENAEIAEALGMTKISVDAACSRLVRAGLLQKKKAGRKTNTLRRDEEMARLHLQGTSPDELAKIFGLEKVTVTNKLQELARKKLIPRKRPEADPSIWPEREAAIWPLLKDGFGYQEIAETTGFTIGVVAMTIMRIKRKGQDYTPHQKATGRKAVVSLMVSASADEEAAIVLIGPAPNPENIQYVQNPDVYTTMIEARNDGQPPV